MTLYVCLLLLVFFLILTLARLCSLCWSHHGPAQSTAAARHTPLQRLLKPRSPRDCPACRLASTFSSVVGPAHPPVRPWHEVKSRRGAPEAGEHRGLRLPQPPVPLLWDHRCSHPRLGWGWQAWPCRANPDLSLSGLPHHLHCPTPHPFVPSENPFPAGRSGAVCAGRRAGSFRRRAGLRLSTSHHHHLAVSRWRARTDLARALLLAISGSRTSSWTNCAPGCAATSRCSGSGWPSIPCTKLLPVLHLGPRTQNMAHRVIHSLRQILAAFLPPALHE